MINKTSKEKISIDIKDKIWFYFQKYSLGTLHSARTFCTVMSKQKAMGKTSKTTFNHINKIVSRHDITAHKGLQC